MKKKILIAFMLIFASQAFASESFDGEYSKEIATISFSPVSALLCNLDLIELDPIDCAGMNVASSFTTTVLLLKEIESAQPDALDYIAGGIPTPHLMDVVNALQSLSLEVDGRPISFDQAVNDIIVNI